MKELRRIGVMVSSCNPSSHHQQVYRGILDYSKEHQGFKCVLAPFAAEDLRGTSRSDRPYDGVLALATSELVKEAMRCKVPVVDVWIDSPVSVPISCVFPDFAMAGRMAAEHLASRGFEHFGYVINEKDKSQATMCDSELLFDESIEKSIGFADYIRANGFDCERFIAPGTVDSSAKIWKKWSWDIRKWINAQPKPLALFVPRDLLCCYIADLAPELGLKVPHDLGLVCADNETNFCVRREPSLTAVDLGYKRVGYEAAALLDSMLSRKHIGKREIRLVEPRGLISRRSTDAVVLDDPIVSKGMRYILEHSHEALRVSDVADAIAVSRRSLERSFRQVLDRTVKQEITRARLGRLKRRLRESGDLLKVLVNDSGFHSVRSMYETFVREEGVSPSEYRARGVTLSKE